MAVNMLTINIRGNDCDKRSKSCDNDVSKLLVEIFMSERINARLSQPLAEFVGRMVGETGLYETPSEYVRDLIRRDMERRGSQFAQDAILTGYRDLAAGHMFESSGNFKADMALLDQKEASGWQ
jgi:antitoxin ParD1/3/4